MKRSGKNSELRKMLELLDAINRVYSMRDSKKSNSGHSDKSSKKQPA